MYFEEMLRELTHKYRIEDKKAQKMAKLEPGELNALIYEAKSMGKNDYEIGLAMVELFRGKQLVLDFKENSTGIETKLINVEANFLRIFPYLTEYKRDKIGNEIIIEREMTNENGEKAKVSLSITKGEETSWPGPLAGKFLEVIEQLLDKQYQENGFIENPIIYNRGTVCTIANMTTPGVSGALKNEVENLHGLHFHSHGMYYYKKENRYIKSSEKSWYPFPRIEDITVKSSTGKEITKYSEIWLDEKYISNYNNNYLAKKDSQYALSLNIPMALKLYKFLASAFYAWNNKLDKRDYLQYFYGTLCSQLIVIKREKYHYNRKLQFKKALEELKSTEYIKDFKWAKRGKKSLLRLWPGKRFFAEVKERRKRWLKFNRTQKDMVAIG